MSTTEGRAGYYRLVASGHGAALAADARTEYSYRTGGAS